MSKLGTTKKLKEKEKITTDWLDFLWEYWIKAKAGFKSELSGRDDTILQAHHIAGKPNKFMRYLLEENGICLTNGEHGFGAHGSQDRQIDFQTSVKALRGHEIYESLHSHRHDEIGGLKSHDIESFLLKKIVPFLPSTVDFYQNKISPTNPDQKHFKRLFRQISSGTEIISATKT